MTSDDYTACHWRRLSDILLCQSTDYWSAHQVYLNRAYIRDRKEARRGNFSGRVPEQSNHCVDESAEDKGEQPHDEHVDNEVRNSQPATASAQEEEEEEEEEVEERAIYIGDLSKEMLKCSISPQVLDTLSDVSSSDEEVPKTVSKTVLREPPKRIEETESDEELAMMRAMGLPTSFVSTSRKRGQYELDEDSSGGLSDDEAQVIDRRAKQKRSKKSRRAADQHHSDQRRLQEKDKEIRRRFDDFWREKGALLKYTAFVQTYGRYLGDDFWRTVPASVARDEYLSQMMPPPGVVQEEEAAEDDDDEDAVEFEWEAVWPDFVKQLRNRWFMWYLYEKNTTPDESSAPLYCAKTSLSEELSCLGCAVDFEQLNAFEPIVVHAKTNRVAVTHSRLASTAGPVTAEVGLGPASDDDDVNGDDADDADVREDPDLRKYWSQRYRLFSRWDEGVRLDRESWFSVTPEKIARHQAERLSDCSVIVDGFCGAGGNAIQFANFCDTVIAVDIDPTKLELAAHNAKVYGVEDRIQFVCADFFKLAPCLRLDPYSTAVFLSPPWGGPAYLDQPVFDLSDLGGLSGFELVEAARRITCNVALFAPRNANVAQLVAMTAPGELVEIEQNFLNNKMKAVTVYFGGIVDDVTASY